MTEDELNNLTEDQQFNILGCGSRCIMKLAELHGKPVSKSDFISRFSYLFPSKRCGLTNTAEQIEMAKELGLCRSSISLRSKRKVLELHANHQTCGVLVLTDQNQNGNDLFHCRLLLGVDVDKDVWLLFSPHADGTDSDDPYSGSDLENQLVHYLVFC